MSAILAVEQLGQELRNEMRALLERHFSGVKLAEFERDLAEKEAVLLLRAPGGELGGFSTLMRWTTPWRGGEAEVFFSGDTIVEPSLRGGTELPRAWSRHVFELAARLAPRPCFWFLICAGYRTYRFLPVFFREFYPHCERPTPPDWQALLDGLARAKFGALYQDGVVHLETSLRHDDCARRSRDPHVSFFVRANPEHARGRELACLTQLSPANLTPCGRRVVGL